MNLTPVQLDRAAGVLVGAAAGDALGAGYEFRSPPEGEPAMIGGGLGHWEPGEWTDDTQMALCIAKVTAGGTVEPDAIGDNFLAWFKSGPADVGVQTSLVLSRAKSGGELAALAHSYHLDHPDRSAGNGSLMRTGPVALAHLGDDQAIAASARAVSGLTHADPLAGDACVLWCIAIDRAIREGRLDGIRDGLLLLPSGKQSFWEAKIREAETANPATFVPNGFVVTALQAAHAAVTQTPVPSPQPCRHLQHALGTAVRIGNDTDTVAAIAGALLGGRWGASAVPLAWKEILHGWPGHGVRDLVRLAILSVRQGQNDSIGWPSAPTLLPYYRREFAPSGTTVELTAEPGIRIGDVIALENLPDSTDVVISLCRIGSNDVRSVEGHEIWLMDSNDPEENPNLDFILRDIASQVTRWRQAGRTVLVHCVRAESRTPTVAAACMAECLGISGHAALSQVRSLLPQSAPNSAFVSALEQNWSRSEGETVA
jgi:ADP-ribosylglycohydrolase